MYFEIPVNMVRPQELVSLLSIFTACISWSRCGSFVTVTEDEAVQLDFPYPCDSNKVTIQSAHRLPFYDSATPNKLNLPFYQFNRFSVTNKNCSVQVQINPVYRNDEATYICQVYRGGVIHSEFTRIRLSVNYPSGDAFCTFSTNDDAVGDWVPVHCEARVNRLAEGIYCYQDSKRLPSWSKLVQIGEHLKQTIWARKKHPVFCCSVILDRPKDMCECKDFVWAPMGYISQTNTIIDPCPATTPGPVATLCCNIKSSQLPQLIESLNLTDTNKDKSTAKSTEISWVGVIGIVNVIIMLLIMLTLICVVDKNNRQFEKKIEE